MKELETLVAALRSLQVEGVAEELQRDLAEKEADLVLKVQSLAGETQLELVTLKGEHFNSQQRIPLFFKLSALDFDRLTGTRRVSGEAGKR